MTRASGTTDFDARVALTEDTDLPERYRAYRRRQARNLVHSLPRAAVRPLYRRAVAFGRATESEPDTDPLALLVHYCEEVLLPLPPFDVWRGDLGRYPAAHLEEASESGMEAVAPADAPTTLAVRALDGAREGWRAHLRGFHEPDGWRAFIAFEDPTRGTLHHTAAIFREEGPRQLVERFQSFDQVSLRALLRSSLP